MCKKIAYFAVCLKHKSVDEIFALANIMPPLSQYAEKNHSYFKMFVTSVFEKVQAEKI